MPPGLVRCAWVILFIHVIFFHTPSNCLPSSRESSFHKSLPQIDPEDPFVGGNLTIQCVFSVLPSTSTEVLNQYRIACPDCKAPIQERMITRKISDKTSLSVAANLWNLSSLNSGHYVCISPQGNSSSELVIVAADKAVVTPEMTLMKEEEEDADCFFELGLHLGWPPSAVTWTFFENPSQPVKICGVDYFTDHYTCGDASPRFVGLNLYLKLYSLRIHSLLPEDSGLYTASMMTANGSVSLWSCTVSVKPKSNANVLELSRNDSKWKPSRLKKLLVALVVLLILIVCLLCCVWFRWKNPEESSKRWFLFKWRSKYEPVDSVPASTSTVQTTLSCDEKQSAYQKRNSDAEYAMIPEQIPVKPPNFADVLSPRRVNDLEASSRCFTSIEAAPDKDLEVVDIYNQSNLSFSVREVSGGRENSQSVEDKHLLTIDNYDSFSQEEDNDAASNDCKQRRAKFRRSREPQC